MAVAMKGVAELLATLVKPAIAIPPNKKRSEVSVGNRASTRMTRRLTLSITSIAIIGATSNSISLAEGNGFWTDELPFPAPIVTNNIANEKTGTRSFIKKGMFVPNIGAKSSAYRINKCAFDLLSLDDLIKEDTLNYVRRFLRIKSTTMYFDFDTIISAAEEPEEKEYLLRIANRLFDNCEKLENATKRKDLSQTRQIYDETTYVLNEIMDRIA